MPGVLHVDDQQRDALVLRQRRDRCARSSSTAAAIDRVRRPHLLAVDRRSGRRRASARVCSPARSEPAFGSLMPMHHTVSPRIAAGASCLLLVVAELEQRRRDDRVAGEVHRPRDAAGSPSPPGRRASAPAWRCGRRARAGSPGSSSRGRRASPASRAPTAGSVSPSSGGARSTAKSRRVARLGRRVLVEERDQLGPERLLLLTPGQVHAAGASALDRRA